MTEAPDNLKETFNLRLPWRYKQRLEREADRRGLSLHALLMEAIEAWYPAKQQHRAEQ